jgi:hypothetical protein
MNDALKQEAKSWLADVPDAYVFWCSDGRTVRNMKDLAEALSTMADEIFAYHASAQKNDFSTWVRDIIRDEKLAGDLLKASNRIQAANMVAERTASLIESLNPSRKPSQTRPSRSKSRR